MMYSSGTSTSEGGGKGRCSKTGIGSACADLLSVNKRDDAWNRLTRGKTGGQVNLRSF